MRAPHAGDQDDDAGGAQCGALAGENQRAKTKAQQDHCSGYAEQRHQLLESPSAFLPLINRHHAFKHLSVHD